MKRPRSNFPNDKDLKKKKVDASLNQHCKSTNNEKISSGKFQTKQAPNKTTLTPGLLSHQDPLFAAITKKILGTKALNYLPAKMTPVKKNATATVKKENSTSSSPAEHQTSKKVQSNFPKQPKVPDSDPSYDSSSGIESLSSIDKPFAVKATAKKKVASTKKLPIASRDSSSNNDEPTSFVINSVLAKPLISPTVNLKREEKAKIQPIPSESSFESSFSESDKPSAVVKATPVTKKKLTGNQLKRGRTESTTSDSSSSSDSQQVSVAAKASSMSDTRQPRKLKGNSSTRKQPSPEVVPRKVAPEQGFQVQSKKRFQSKLLISEESTSDSCDSEPPSRVQTSQKIMLEKTSIKPKDVGKSNPMMAKGSFSKSPPSSGKMTQKIFPKIATNQARGPVIPAPCYSSSDSSSSSDSEAPPVNTIAKKVTLKGKVWEGSNSSSLAVITAPCISSSDTSSSSDSEPLPVKPTASKFVPKKLVSEDSDSSESSESEPPPVKPTASKFVPKKLVSEDSDSSASSESEPPPVKPLANKFVSKKMVSEDSDSSASSESEPPPVKPLANKFVSKKMVSKDSDSTSSSESDPPLVKPTGKKVVPRKEASEDSDSSLSSESELPPVKPITKQFVPKMTVSVDSGSSSSSESELPLVKSIAKKLVPKKEVPKISNSSSSSDSKPTPVKPIPKKIVPKKNLPKDSRKSKGARETLNSADSQFSATAMNNYSTSHSIFLGGAEFRKQPPICVRKMNIIDMDLSLYDVKAKPVNIEKVCFVSFIEDEDPSNARRNGIHYRIAASFSDGTSDLQDIYLRVVDGRDGDLISYEGKDIAEDLQRVLLTHETTCARCRANESCGTRAKTPGNPVIIDGKILKFYVRCNTTCAVRTGGNVGKRKCRTFKFVFSTSPSLTEESILASSTEVNVHHNTKMNRLLNEGFNPISREWGEPLPIHNS